MKIHDYILSAARTYCYRIKSIAPLDDAALDVVEKVILRYDPVSMSRVRKTMFQSHPLDFSFVANAEVYIVDVELCLPVSPSVLHAAIVAGLKCADKFIVVRGENDPTELETERLAAEAAMAQQAAEAGLRHGSLLAAEKYEEFEERPGEELYGDDYNGRLVSYMGKVEQERSEAAKVEPANPLFRWMDIPDRESQQPVQDGSDFNAAMKGDTNGSQPPARVSRHGNLTDDGRVYKRVYRGSSGDNIVQSPKGS
jgi:hypothetical protein